MARAELTALLDELDLLYQEMGGKLEAPPVEVPEEAEPVIRAVQRQLSRPWSERELHGRICFFEQQAVRATVTIMLGTV